MAIKRSLGEKIFDACNVIFLVIASLLVVIPVVHVIAGSFSSTQALIQNKVFLLPVDFNLDNYKLVIQNKTFWSTFKNSVLLVVVGTAINMVMTLVTAYPLSKSYLKGRKVFILAFVFTMIFHAPLIPTYILIRNLGLLDTFWALVVPPAIGMFNLIMCITFFRSLPEELFEAARVDGMSEYRILWKIAVPLSMPIVVTLLLFYAVNHWNSYFNALIYITDRKLYPLQLYLYHLLAEANAIDNYRGVNTLASLDTSPQGLQLATIVVATVPIVIIYPFLQKHFIKGAMLGSLKE